MILETTTTLEEQYSEILDLYVNGLEQDFKIQVFLLTTKECEAMIIYFEALFQYEIWETGELSQTQFDDFIGAIRYSNNNLDGTLVRV